MERDNKKNQEKKQEVVEVQGRAQTRNKAPTTT